eukprot:266068-Prorocentrum_minimum.AAC.2
MGTRQLYTAPIRGTLTVPSSMPCLLPASSYVRRIAITFQTKQLSLNPSICGVRTRARHGHCGRIDH